MPLPPSPWSPLQTRPPSIMSKPMLVKMALVTKTLPDYSLPVHPWIFFEHTCPILISMEPTIKPMIFTYARYTVEKLDFLDLENCRRRTRWDENSDRVWRWWRHGACPPRQQLTFWRENITVKFIFLLSLRRYFFYRALTCNRTIIFEAIPIEIHWKISFEK